MAGKEVSALEYESRSVAVIGVDIRTGEGVLFPPRINISLKTQSPSSTDLIELSCCTECCQVALNMSCDGRWDLCRRRECQIGQSARSPCKLAHEFVIQCWKLLSVNIADEDSLDEHMHPVHLDLGTGQCEVSFKLTKAQLRHAMNPDIMIGTYENYNLMRYNHASGCFYSDDPSCMIKHHNEKPNIGKDLNFRICNGAWVNIEGIILGVSAGRELPRGEDMTKTQNILAWRLKQLYGYTCHLSFDIYATDEGRKMRDEMIRLLSNVNYDMLEDDETLLQDGYSDGRTSDGDDSDYGYDRACDGRRADDIYQ